jgi:drug/metabolite transporter (DMT)-like permease
VDPKRLALKRWLYFALGWQSLVILGVLLYVFVMTRRHQTDLYWIAPVLAALLGTALPYQLAAMRLSRAGRS